MEPSDTIMKVQGYAAQSAKATLAPFSFERREPRDHDIVVDIQYCGICHTDIHQVGDEWGGSMFPMVPGHEITGIVSKTGPKVTKYKTGDRVGVGCFVDSCRKCEPCKKNLEQYCTGGMVTTYNGTEKDGTTTQGGYSNKIVVDENYVLKIPDALPLDKAAPLLCAGITLYSPLLHWNAGPGKKVAIIGLGGIGHMGGIKETQEMLDFCGKKNIASEIELIPIQKVNEAYKRVLNSDVRYRFVIDIKSLEQK